MTIPSIISVLQAHERGEKIEMRAKRDGPEWYYCPNPGWDFFGCEYRVATPPTPIPLTPADVPPGSVVRNNYQSLDVWVSVTGVGPVGAVLGNNSRVILWPQLAADWQILRPGGVWEPANKTIP